MKHLVIGQRLKPPNFSAFHWSLRGSLVSIGQHFVATRVVHLPKSIETCLMTESDESGPNPQLLQLCTARTAWSDSDQLSGPCIAVIAGSRMNLVSGAMVALWGIAYVLFLIYTVFGIDLFLYTKVVKETRA